MKRAICTALLLYPRPWRARYAAEFEALIEDMNPTWRDLFNTVTAALGVRMRSLGKGPVWQTLAVFTVLGALAGAIAASLIPVRYDSSAVLQYEGSNEQLAAIVQKTLTRRSLATIINTRHVYEDVTKPLEDNVEDLKRAITVTRVNDHAFWIRVSYKDPAVAQQVTADVVRLFVTAAPMQLIDGPSLPRKPISPIVSRVILAGTVAGLLVGILVAAFTTRIRPTPPRLPA